MFSRYLVESLQRSYLISERAQLKTLDNASKETTPFNQIFGGYMRQDVTCLRCKYVSTTFQHFMDLLLDIRQVSNIEDALKMHFRQEKIGGNGENADSMYKCEKCHIKVPAKKQSLIERPPAVLCIQLKRFSLLGGKISKSVQLSRTIDMAQFVNPAANGSGGEVQYKLVSMITHVGQSPNCGHYTAIGEAAGGQFFQFDDSSVRPISVGQAMNTASYVVFYEMTKASWDRRLNPGTATTSAPSPSPSTSNGHQNGNKASLPHVAPKVIPQPTTVQNFKPRLISSISSHATPVVNRFGVVAANIKKTVVSLATNGHQTPAPKTNLVPYDDDSDSEAATTAKSSEVVKVTPPPPPPQPKQTPPAANGNPFVPRSVTVNALKREQELKPVLPPASKPLLPSPNSSTDSSSASIETRKSASGNWTVTDVDHHNPSIASDGSCGSTSGTWKVTSTKPNEVKTAASPWTPLASKGSPVEPSTTTVSEKGIVSNGGTTNGNGHAADNGHIKNEPEVKQADQQQQPRLVREAFEPSIFSTARKRGSVDDSDADDYDAEFDRGRTKKVRKAITAPTSDASDRSNPFQSAQNHQYQKRSGDHSESNSSRHHHQSWNNSSSRFHQDHSRSRSFDQDRGRRHSFGGNDFRDSHHHGGGGGNKYNHRQEQPHHHHKSKPGFNHSFSANRRDDYGGNRNNSFRYNRR